MCTVQAPHMAMPQPNLVPVMLSVSLRTQSSGISGTASTVCVFPFKVNLMDPMLNLAQGLGRSTNVLRILPSGEEWVVGTGRFELPTCRLGGGRSIHLSYVPSLDPIVARLHWRTACGQRFRPL